MLRLVTAPTVEPVSLAEAKAHLRLESAADDDYVTQLITAAREWAEKYCRRAFVTQTWELVSDAFPDGDVIDLAKGKLESVTSVKYLDADGIEQTLATADYDVDTGTEPGRVILGYDKSWPRTRAQWNAVVVRFVVGTDAAEVPAAVKQAVLLLVSQLYEHRTPEVLGTVVSQVRFAVESLLGPHRLVRF